MSYLKDEQNHIEAISSLIERYENNPLRGFDPIKRLLACRYKEHGDATINLYRDTYAMHQLVRHDLADISFASYEKAIWLFDDIEENLGGIYARFAFGNACKERCLPNMDSSLSQGYQDLAAENFEQCVSRCFTDENQFTQEYFFTQLLQENLLVRQKTLRSGLLPKNIVIFHSLKSAQSRKCLYGLYYLADRNCCEIWEYRFGKVRALDPPEEYIRHRLVESSASVFIASTDYDPLNNDIIEFEIATTISLKKLGDPLTVFVVDLGNREVIDRLHSVATVVASEEIDKIFSGDSNKIRDIYFCRRYRCEHNIKY